MKKPIAVGKLYSSIEIERHILLTVTPFWVRTRLDSSMLANGVSFPPEWK
jgi:hypothetical protein